MAGEGVFPKSDGDVGYASEANRAWYGAMPNWAAARVRYASDVTISSNTNYATGYYFAKDFTVDATFTLTAQGRVVIFADTITVNGNISANGEGAAATADNGFVAGNGGGGGAGVAPSESGVTGGSGETTSGGAGGAVGGGATSPGHGGDKSTNFGVDEDVRIAEVLGLSPRRWSGINNFSFLNSSSSTFGLMEAARGGNGGRAGSGSNMGTGGQGGGAIVLIARVVDIDSGSTISANGDDGTDGGTAGGEGAGGGAGGSAGLIIVVGHSTTGTGTLTAIGGDGGDGGNTTYDGGGGAGGNGGYILCFGDDATTPWTQTVTAGTAGALGATAAENGNAGVATWYQI